MKGFLEVRTKLGLTQEQMAAWLSSNRSSYAQVETGRRDLPTAAFMRWTELAQKIATASAQAPLPVAAKAWLQASRSAALQKAAQDCNRKSRSLQRKLQKMQARATQCQLLLQTLAALRQQPPAGKLAQRDSLWMTATEAEALQALKQCGPVQQELLQLQIDSQHWMLGKISG